MKKNNINVTLQLSFFTVIFVLWSLIVSLLFTWMNPQLNFIGIAVYFLVVVVSLANLFPYIEFVGLIIGTGIYVLSLYSVMAVDRSFLIQSGAAFLIYLVTVLLCMWVLNTIRRIKAKEKHQQQVLNDLMVFDPDTTLMQYRYAMQKINTEIGRSRRNGSPLTVMLIDLLGNKDLTDKEKADLRKETAKVVPSCIRTDLDAAFINEDTLGVILPETPAGGAQVVAWRIINKTHKKLMLDLGVGISTFPDDSVNDEEMLAHARTALDVALSTEQPVVQFANLAKNETESTPLQAQITPPAAASSTVQKTAGFSAAKPAEASSAVPSVQQAVRMSDQPLTKAAAFSAAAAGESLVRQPASQPGEIPASAQDAPSESSDRLAQSEVLKLAHTSLDQGEYLVWVDHVESMSRFSEIQNELRKNEHTINVSMLLLQENKMILKLKTNCPDERDYQKYYPNIIENVWKE